MLLMDPNPKQPETDNPTRKTLFGKYEMGRMLGQGTFAKVYYCKNVATQESVAIKVISKEQVKKAEMMEQIEREIAVMKLVQHPNVVELKEVMATKSKIFVVMEYVKGGELFAKVVKGKLEEEQARKYFQQLISAVDYCHSRGVSHRDLKPENLLLDDAGNLKVSDFGLSALPEQLWQDGLLHTQCGTPAYVAPEVLRKKGYSGEKADIWSCGVVLYVLLAGFLPFRDENVMNLYRKVFKAEYEFPPWFPPEVKKLVAKLLVVDPTRRLSITGIMKSPWFVKGFSRQNIQIPEPINEPSPTKDPTTTEPWAATSPRFYNAFEFISSVSSGFDISSLFESGRLRRSRSLFTSKLSASSIMSRLEGAGKKLNFVVSSGKDYRVKMKGRREGRKGPLEVMAEVFEVAPELAVVEFSKCSGDTLEYVKFCEEDVRPALKDIVWSWPGDNNNYVIYLLMTGHLIDTEWGVSRIIFFSNRFNERFEVS
ncbi:hypothetical protein V2J09_005368 [Rumex salicifolius]